MCVFLVCYSNYAVLTYDCLNTTATGIKPLNQLILFNTTVRGPVNDFIIYTQNTFYPVSISLLALSSENYCLQPSDIGQKIPKIGVPS